MHGRISVALELKRCTCVRMRNEDNHMSARKLKYIIRGISLLHSIGTIATLNYFNVRETLLFFFGKIT